MKLKTNQRNVFKSEEFKNKTFHIAANAKAFEILSSRLYSDKFGAIVRELSTNAYDAHIESGNKDKPFDVHLPTSLSPEFWIRDYGTGISEEQIENIYTVYFESNKTHSDDFVGCLGLGSKSPFSYTNAFDVINFRDGLKTFYTCVINESGVPELLNRGEVETDEPNGLMVKIAVKKEDFYHFEQAARDKYTYFDVKPNFVGQSKISCPNLRYVLKAETFGVRNQSVGIPSSIIMGNVRYPIDVNRISNKVKNSRLSFDFYCPIGTFPITANREGIEYIEGVEDKLRELFENAESFMRKNLEEYIDNLSSLWDVNMAINNVPYELYNFVAPIKYKGSVIEQSYDIKIPKELVLKDYNFIRNTRSLKSTRFENTSIPIRKGNVIFICKENQLVEMRKKAKSYMCENLDLRSRILLLKDDKDTKKFLKDTGLKQFAVYYKDIKELKESKTVTRTYVKGQVFLFKNTFFDKIKSRHWLEVSEFDINAGGIFVKLNKFTYDKITLSYVDLIHSLNTINYLSGIYNINSSIKFYGIRSPLSEKVEKLDNWIHLHDFINNEIKKFPELLEQYITIKAIRRSNISNYASNAINYSKNHVFEKSNNLNKYYKIYDFHYPYDQSISVLMDYVYGYSALEKAIEDLAKHYKAIFNEVTQEIKEKYPLVNSLRGGDMLNKRYIEEIDELHELRKRFANSP